jgi:hypothetical protein
MPAVTDSSTKLTYFANCFTIGLLRITYLSGHLIGLGKGPNQSWQDQTNRQDFMGFLDDAPLRPKGR